MGIMATASTSVLLPVGGLWVIEVKTTDSDGYAVDSAPSVTVTLPGGTTSAPTVGQVTTGRYRVEYIASTTGRYVARVVSATHGAVDFAAYVAATTAGTGMPTTDDVAAYLRESAASWSTDDLQDALDAESAAQRSVCRVGAVYPDDLRQALLRRVQRNLSMRQLPLAVLTGDADTGASILPGRDPEVRRLEAPHRKLVMG
ncbi:hypothetical protein [Micromonospora mirobrigensis]|uniref:Uncharacterized protein n=1 Tax=Micromonospora mirobrigensis TaxID=262898 RepID=A0A1C4XDX7_9ACTN|nr:hypothetical protein [Micromonospora mirobrigensis]SCF06514.1 hypothetical protein GA0070564_10314 [Micromonospora mirobrigensis]